MAVHVHEGCQKKLGVLFHVSAQVNTEMNNTDSEGQIMPSGNCHREKAKIFSLKKLESASSGTCSAPGSD